MTNDTTPAVTNNHGKSTAYFHDAVDDEDETYTDQLNREANREAIREANRATDAEGTAPITIVQPRDRLMDKDKNIYTFWIRGSGKLKSDQEEADVSHKEILQKSRERYDRLMARQRELPEEERLIDWRKRLEQRGEVW